MVASIKILIIALDNDNKGSISGLVFGITSVLGFAISVSLRWRKETPKFTTVASAGLICATFSGLIILNQDLNFVNN